MNKAFDVLGWAVVIAIFVGCVAYLLSVSPVDVNAFFEVLEATKK